MTLTSLDWTIIWVLLGIMAIQGMAGIFDKIRSRVDTALMVFLGLAWGSVVDIGVARLLHAPFSQVIFLNLILVALALAVMLVVAGIVILIIGAAKK